MTEIGDTKVENKMLLRWTGKVWEVVGPAPLPPAGSRPMRGRPEDTEALNDDDE